MSATSRRSVIGGLIILAAIALLIPIYNAPIWWVSLNAPQYPEEAFPDGVRINFHLNGVFSGCEKVEKAEIQEEEALDCVHEMDTINHYVGMYPIAAGGPIELSLSIFLLSFIGVLLLGFIFTRPLVRTSVMGAGFIVIAVWMGMTWLGDGGLKYHNATYLAGRVSVLGEATEDEPAQLTSGEAIIARLKASLEESEPGEPAGEPEEGQSEKTKRIEQLREVFDQDQKRLQGESADWNGSGAQLLSWHYRKSLGRYFNDPQEIGPMVAKMSRAGHVAFWVILGFVGLFIIAAHRTKGPFYWLLVLLPMTLPLLFLIEYSAWLWWYGHNMSSMGAFTLKPFMPTVFGQGKVAQFTTNSYPHYGFWLMVAFSVLLALGALIRRKQMQSEND